MGAGGGSPGPTSQEDPADAARVLGVPRHLDAGLEEAELALDAGEGLGQRRLRGLLCGMRWSGGSAAPTPPQTQTPPSLTILGEARGWPEGDSGDAGDAGAGAELGEVLLQEPGALVFLCGQGDTGMRGPPHSPPPAAGAARSPVPCSAFLPAPFASSSAAATFSLGARSPRRLMAAAGGHMGG